MNTRVHAIRTLVVVIVLLAPATALGKNARPDQKPDVHPTLKVGQWIRLDGVMMKDRTVRCTELKVLAGDFLDDDWGLTGQIDDVDVRRRQLMIGNIAIRVAEDAVLERPHGHFASFADLRRGMIVEVDGTYLEGRTFLANEVDDESDEITFPPGERRLRVVGRVERTDPRRRQIQAMGTVFIVTDKTQVKSAIR